jgi:hypothetical protein
LARFFLSYVCLVGDDADNGRHEDGVYEGQAGCSRGPSEVLVSVRGHIYLRRGGVSRSVDFSFFPCHINLLSE